MLFFCNRGHCIFQFGCAKLTVRFRKPEGARAIIALKFVPKNDEDSLNFNLTSFAIYIPHIMLLAVEIVFTMYPSPLPLPPLQVLSLLSVMGLKAYQERFEQEQVNGEILSECDEEVLKNDLGINSKLHRMRLLKVISGTSKGYGV